MGDAAAANDGSSAEKADNSVTEKQLVIATQDDDGIWRDSEGNALPVSASDLERHAYCPLSWHLARSGVSGSGEAIELGQKKHKEIENAMRDYRRKDIESRREMVIWSWWFAVVVTLTLDTIVLFFVRNTIVSPDNVIFSDFDLILFARYLVLLALVWLLFAMVLLLLPWRKLLGSPFGLAQPPQPSEFDVEDIGLFYFESDNVDKGGWGVGGKIEFAVILGSLTIALHGFTLYYAIISPKLTSSILVIATIFWTLFAAGQLQRVLRTSSDVEKHGEKLGIETGTAVVYNDDSRTSELLQDSKTGLRGRPDQIVIIENEIIPVEQKTGKIPKKPHFSHKLQLYAYLHLVSEITNKTSYGILRYGDEQLHKIKWNDDRKAELMGHLKEVQRLMVEGGAKRNHSRVGKCKSCSRKHRCPMPLT
jgi:CRISPR-associated exonuclease Cas4